MGIKKGAVYDLLSQASKQYILDPGGSPGGNVYTTWNSAITAALADSGNRTILVLGAVTVSTGTFGNGLNNIELIGSAGAPVQITFDGDATHTSFFRVARNINFNLTGTAIPFSVSGSGSIEFDRCSLTTTVAFPVLQVNGNSSVVDIHLNNTDLTGNASAPALKAADGLLGPTLNVDAYGACTCNEQSIGCGSNAFTGSIINFNAYTSLCPFPPSLPQAHVAGPFNYQAPGGGATYTDTVAVDTTYYYPNGTIEDTDLTASNLTIDQDYFVNNPAHWFHVVRAKTTVASYLDQYLRITLANGPFWFGGNDGRNLRNLGEDWHANYTPDGWTLRGRDGLEDTSDEWPSTISGRLQTTDAAVKSAHERLFPVFGDVMALTAEIVALSGANKAMFRVEAVIRNQGPPMSIRPNPNGLTTVIHRDDVNMTANFTINSNNIRLNVQNASGTSTDWGFKLRIHYPFDV